MPTAGIFLEYDVVEAEEKNRGHYVTVAQMFTKKIVSSKFDEQGMRIKGFVHLWQHQPMKYFISKPCLYTSSTPGQKPNMVAALELGWCRWHPDFAIFASWYTSRQVTRLSCLWGLRLVDI